MRGTQNRDKKDTLGTPFAQARWRMIVVYLFGCNKRLCKIFSAAALVQKKGIRNLKLFFICLSMHTARMCAEKASEWGLPGLTLWVASLDLEKAFDKVGAEALEESLISAELDPGYVDAITDLYVDLSLYVEIEKATCSRDVLVKRGVRQ